MRTCWTYIYFLLWAIWWGGLTLYASTVVPLGTGVVGSHSQGLITQQVTVVLNVLSFAVVFFTILKALSMGSRWIWATSLSLAFLACLALYQHQLLSQMLEENADTNSNQFYRMHATYLWITTAQWMIGSALPVFCISSLTCSASHGER